MFSIARSFGMHTDQNGMVSHGETDMEACLFILSAWFGLMQLCIVVLSSFHVFVHLDCLMVDSISHGQFLWPFLIWEPAFAIGLLPMTWLFVPVRYQMLDALLLLHVPVVMICTSLQFFLQSLHIFWVMVKNKKIEAHDDSFHHSYLYVPWEQLSVGSSSFFSGILCKGCIRVHPLWMFVMAAPLLLGREMPWVWGGFAFLSGNPRCTIPFGHST